MHVTYEYTYALMHALVCQSIATGKVVYLDIMTIGSIGILCDKSSRYRSIGREYLIDYYPI